MTCSQKQNNTHTDTHIFIIVAKKNNTTKLINTFVILIL